MELSFHKHRFRIFVFLTLWIMVGGSDYLSVSWSAEPQILKFEGKVKRGKVFSHPLNENLNFVLIPNSQGWSIFVRSSNHPDKNLALFTPPYHGPNPLYIDGWHFRNSDNTGPNEIPKSLNVPQETRDFIFSSKAATAKFPTTGEELEHIEETFSRGILTVKNYKLGNLFPNEKAFFKWMEFSVKIELKE